MISRRMEKLNLSNIPIVTFTKIQGQEVQVSKVLINGSQLKNPDISGALYTLGIQYSYTQIQCEDGARDVRVR